MSSLFLAIGFAWLAMGQSSSEDLAACSAGSSSSCPAAPDVEFSAVVQTRKMAVGRQKPALSAAAAGELPRIAIVEGKLKQGDVEVLPLGGNYAVKAQPYYPPVHVVTKDAKAMAAGLASSKYKPSDGRQVVPMVRLTTYFEGAMPNEPGVFDSAWQARLEATVKAFAAEGVYVLLDIHQDALATTNGGAGLPWWMTANMQETAGSVPGCSHCTAQDSYIASPEHPLDFLLPTIIQEGLQALGFSIPVVEIVNGTDPWLAYSVGGNAGDPGSMNVGNINMRANNNDAAWQRGTILLTHQVQNVAWRFYRAHKYPADKAAIFDHYMTFLRYLVTVWEGHSNVVAIDLLNEPPFGGLPSPIAAKSSRTDLFSFYAAVLDELDAGPTPTKAPVVIEDIGGTSLPSVVGALAQVLGVDDISKSALEKLSKWTAKGQLIYSFHWYPSSPTTASLETYVAGARALAGELGNPPIYLGEFWTGSASTSAHWLAVAAELGLNAATYWQYVDSDYTKTPGWYRYPEGVPASTFDFTTANDIDWQAWWTYEKTVADGTYWGAYICGAAGGHMGVLNLLEEVEVGTPFAPLPLSLPNLSQPLITGGGHGSSGRAKLSVA